MLPIFFDGLLGNNDGFIFSQVRCFSRHLSAEESQKGEVLCQIQNTTVSKENLILIKVPKTWADFQQLTSLSRYSEG